MMGPAENKPVLLVFPFGLLSHYLRCLVLCRHLRRHFDVRFLFNGSFDSFIEEEQFDTFRCKTIDAAYAIQGVKNINFEWLNEFDLERTYLDEVRVIKQLKPIAVLGDHTPTLKMSTETCGVQFISLLNGYFTKYYAGHRRISRTHPAYPLINMLPGSLGKFFTKHGEENAFRRIHKPYKKIRQKYNLIPQSLYPDEFEGDLTLICDVPELFPQMPGPENYFSIGPLVYGWSSQINDRPGFLNANKKTLYASMGSTGDWQKINFLNNPSFAKYNIIATGDHKKILRGNHITHLPFANIHEIFPFTDLVICHGGNGTVYQALLHEIPVLCKTSHCEQEWNTVELEKKQLGKNMDALSTSLEYTDTIEKWIEKKGCKQFKHFSDEIKLQTHQLSYRVKMISNIILRERLLPGSHRSYENLTMK